MLKENDINRLKLIIRHCDRVADKIKNIFFESFSNNQDLIDVTCFNILQIGEIANGLSSELIKTYSSIPWRQIIGLRNRIVHGYGSVNPTIVYNTASIDVKELEENIMKIIGDN